MDKNQLFKQYYDRLAKEGILKALICGLIVGFSASLISGLVTFILIYGGLWAALISWALGVAGGTVFFYYKKFRPTTKMVAERVDRLGLEERLITMLALENDASYIAMRQREDALERLSKVNHRSVRITIFKMPIIIMAIVALFSVSMVTVSEISASGHGVWLPNIPDYSGVEYNVSYSVSDGGNGMIYGDLQQIVAHGEDGDWVVAIPDEGYMFKEWSDGVDSPERYEMLVMEDIDLIAYFDKIDPTPNDGDTEKSDEESEPEETGAPPIPAEPDDQEGGQTPPEYLPGDPNAEGGGKYEPNNQIVDGQTYYRDEFDVYYDACMDRLASGEELTEAQKAFIRLYFDIII